MTHDFVVNNLLAYTISDEGISYRIYEPEWLMKTDSTNPTIVATVVSQAMESLKNAPSLLIRTSTMFERRNSPC